MALVKIYSGSEIEATPIKLTLEDAGINPVVKDNIQSATVTGFGPIGQAMELYVEEHEVEAAAKIVAGFNK